MEERGVVDRPDPAETVVATVHPARILRKADGVRGADWEAFQYRCQWSSMPGTSEQFDR